MTSGLPKRRNLRLTDFDYSQAGCYFVTICTKNKRCIFGKGVGAATCRPPTEAQAGLSQIGNIVQETIIDIPNHYSGVQVDKFVVMPNHVHVIIIIRPDAQNGRQIAAPTPSLSNVIGQMKRVASIKARQQLWQKGYYDHIVRNEEDYQRI